MYFVRVRRYLVAEMKSYSEYKCVCVLVLSSNHGRWFCIEGVLGAAAALITLSIPLTLSPPHTNISTHRAPEKYSGIT